MRVFRNSKWFWIKGFEQEFLLLQELVTHLWDETPFEDVDEGHNVSVVYPWNPRERSSRRSWTVSQG